MRTLVLKLPNLTTFFSESSSTTDQSSTLRFELNFIQLWTLFLAGSLSLNHWSISTQNKLKRFEKYSFALNFREIINQISLIDNERFNVWYDCSLDFDWIIATNQIFSLTESEALKQPSSILYLSKNGVDNVFLILNPFVDNKDEINWHFQFPLSYQHFFISLKCFCNLIPNNIALHLNVIKSRLMATIK